jgi:hypothetical protein
MITWRSRDSWKASMPSTHRGKELFTENFACGRSIAYCYRDGVNSIRELRGSGKHGARHLFCS